MTHKAAFGVCYRRSVTTPVPASRLSRFLLICARRTPQRAPVTREPDRATGARLVAEEPGQSDARPAVPGPDYGHILDSNEGVSQPRSTGDARAARRRRCS